MWPRHQGTGYVRPTSPGRVPAEACTDRYEWPHQKGMVSNPSPATSTPRVPVRVSFCVRALPVAWSAELRSALSSLPYSFVAPPGDGRPALLEGGASVSKTVKQMTGTVSSPCSHRGRSLTLPAVILPRFLGDIRLDTVRSPISRPGPFHVVTAGSMGKGASRPAPQKLNGPVTICCTNEQWRAIRSDSTGPST
jgi:hypothetical protein